MKKCIVLFLALVITVSTLAACAAGVPSSSSSYVPVSSSVVSALSQSSSVAMSSLPQSSSVSAVSSLPVSSASVPEEGSVLISETETHSTYLITVTTFLGSIANNFEIETDMSYVLYEITIPKPFFIEETTAYQILDDFDKVKWAELGSISVLSEGETIMDLTAPSGIDIYYENGFTVLPSGHEVAYSISTSEFDSGHTFLFLYYFKINEISAIDIGFYNFFPPENYDPANDHAMFLEIMNSIKVVEIV